MYFAMLLFACHRAHKMNINTYYNKKQHKSSQYINTQKYAFIYACSSNMEVSLSEVNAACA